MGGGGGEMKQGGPCDHCKRTESPLWRKGPDEKPVLCNACGARWLVKRNLEGYVPGAPLVPTNRCQRNRGGGERKHKKAPAGDGPPRPHRVGGAAGELAGLLAGGVDLLPAGGKRQRRPNARYTNERSPERTGSQMKKARSAPNLQAQLALAFSGSSFGGQVAVPSYSASIALPVSRPHHVHHSHSNHLNGAVPLQQAQLVARRHSGLEATFDSQRPQLGGYVALPAHQMADGTIVHLGQPTEHQPHAHVIGLLPHLEMAPVGQHQQQGLPEGAVPYGEWAATYQRLANHGIFDSSAHLGSNELTRERYQKLVSMRNGILVDPAGSNNVESVYQQQQQGRGQPCASTSFVAADVLSVGGDGFASSFDDPLLIDSALQHDSLFMQPCGPQGNHSPVP